MNKKLNNSNNNEKLNVGDVVYLKSDLKKELLMTVSFISDNETCICIWHSNGELKTSSFIQIATINKMNFSNPRLSKIKSSNLTPEQLKIKKGELFLCIKDVVMNDNNILYYKDSYYESDNDNCITGINNDEEHSWECDGTDDDWPNYFERIT